MIAIRTKTDEAVARLRPYREAEQRELDALSEETSARLTALLPRLEGDPCLRGMVELLKPRIRTTCGFAPSGIVAQLLFTLTSGGCSLADAERLGEDRVLLELIGLAKTADQTTLGQWLRAQTKESVLALLDLNAQFVDWVWAQSPRGRVLHGGYAEYFFDDTEVEVYGKKIEGARMNYEGNLALSWQVLWKGPFVLDHQLDGAGEVSEHLPAFLAEHQPRWQGEKSYLYVDSGSSAAKYVNAIDQAGFTRWSISYNKWTEKLEKLAAELRASQWSPLPAQEAKAPAVPTEEYAWLRRLPGECARASVRRRAPEGPRRDVPPLWVCDV